MRFSCRSAIRLFDRSRQLGDLSFRVAEQFSRQRDVVGARACGKQAVVADAVQALRLHVDQNAPDELGGCQRHRRVSRWSSRLVTSRCTLLATCA